MALEILAAVAIINSMRLSRWFSDHGIFANKKPEEWAGPNKKPPCVWPRVGCSAPRLLGVKLMRVSQALTWTLEIWAWPCPDLSPLGMRKLIFSSPPIGHWWSSLASDWSTQHGDTQPCVTALGLLLIPTVPGPVNKKIENIQTNLFPAKKKCLPNLDMWGTIRTKRVKYVNTDKCFTSVL